jgi:carboxyl-terminal processing protease
VVGKKLGILFLFSVILAFFAGYFSSRVLPEFSPRNTQDIFDFITDSLELNYLYDLEETEKNIAFVRSMEAIVEAYARLNNDPYTRVVSSSLSVSPGSDETFVGIGVGFSFEGLNLRIGFVYLEGAAHGLLYPNDLITGVIQNEETTLFDSLQSEAEVLSLLSGTLGEMKSFVVMNPDGIIQVVNITYQAIETPSVYALNLLEPNIGYIRITHFSSAPNASTLGTAGLFQNLLNTLETSVLAPGGAQKTLILDLRDNPGGSLSALHNQNQSAQVPGIAQQLIRKNLDQTIFTMIPKSGVVQNFYGNLAAPKPYNIAILVNEQSASAAEVLAAALMGEGYTLYGQQTYGKGVYQNQVRITDIGNVRYSLVYTEGQWFYGNNLNVSTTPLLVTPILQTGMKSLSMPVYRGTVSFNQVSQALSLYQSFLNEYYQLSGNQTLRTDGYFDANTQTAIQMFQIEQEISVTGQLDLSTARKIHTLFMELTSDVSNDMQLAQLVELLRG